MRRLWLAILISILPASVWANTCDPERVDIRGDFGTLTFNVELADTPETRARGLMFRESMPTRAGMLFVNPRPQRTTFWMRNTLISLDMLFITQEGVVHHIHENAIPLDETVIYGGEDIKYVLEINGGLSARFGIAEGAEIRHTSIPSGLAVWSCENE